MSGVVGSSDTSAEAAFAPGACSPAALGALFPASLQPRHPIGNPSVPIFVRSESNWSSAVGRATTLASTGAGAPATVTRNVSTLSLLTVVLSRPYTVTVFEPAVTAGSSLLAHFDESACALSLRTRYADCTST